MDEKVLVSLEQVKKPLLQYIRRYWRANYQSPTFHEMGAQVGKDLEVNRPISKSQISRALQSLRDEGDLLLLEGTSRIAVPNFVVWAIKNIDKQRIVVPYDVVNAIIDEEP